MKPIGMAVLGAWHVHAREYAEAFSQAPGVRVCCVWDEDAARGRALADGLQCPFVPTLDEALNHSAVTAVQVTTSTNAHTEVMLAAAQHGKHIFTEKVLTIAPRDAERVMQEVQQQEVCFAISFPHLSRPAVMQAKALMQQGALGRVHYARVRNVHDGAVAGWLPDHFYDSLTCGGGAMMDLGAHPMYTLAWLLGEPSGARSLFTHVTDKAVEDNAVTLLSFPEGAIGVSETGFVSRHNPYTLELSGDKGYALVQGDRLYVAAGANKQALQEVTALPAAAPSPLQQFVETLRQPHPGRVDMGDIGIAPAVRLTRMMDMAYRGQ